MLAVEGSGIVELKNNRVVGIAGKHFDRFFTYKNQR